MALLEHPGSGSEKSQAEFRARRLRANQNPISEKPLHQRFIDEIDLRQMGSKLWRWRGLIITVACLWVLASVAVVQRLTPVYTAATQIAIGTEQMPLLKLDQVIADVKGDNESVATEIGIIRSRKLAQKTVLKLGLDSMPEFSAPLSLTQRLIAFAREQRYVSIPWLDNRPSPQPEDFDVGRKLNKVVDTVLDRLKVTNDGKSRIITLSFESASPELAAQIVNTFADFYITAQLDAKLEATKRASLWLSDQLAALRQEVLASDDAVERFRRDHNLVRGPTSTITNQQMSQVATEAMTAHTKLLEAQSRLIQVQRSDLSRGRISGDALPEVLQSPLIQALRGQEADASRRLADLLSRFGNKHPAVIDVRNQLADIHDRIQSEVAKVTEALRNEIANQQARENSLDALLEKVKADESRSNVNEVQLHELEREAQANKTLYESLLQRLKETQSQQGFQQANAEIISPASTPIDPSFPQKTVMILLSVLTGLAIGALLALVCENMDVGLRSMEQVDQLLRLNPLGMVPTLGLTSKWSRPEREVLERPMSAYSEALRTVHANILLSDLDAPPKSILVTSSLPGEGKSTIALSLAFTMVREKRRVLLIDCDLRRPTVHKLSGTPSNPGLVDLLLGKMQLIEIIQTHQTSGLHVITAGHLPSVPPNLLGSQRFQLMLKQIREQYDFIILDSAPVLAIADTRVLSALTDKTLFVVHWATTARKVAGACINQLQRAGADIAGVVLTKVDVKVHAKDAFSDSVLYTGRLKHYYR